MIKVQGLGRRRAGMSHEACIAHHRNIHSKLGLGQADHMGKYVLYYFREAFSAGGAPVADFPWDMSALEWFREPEYWNNFQKWLEAAPDGQEVKDDEASFLQRDQCFMCPYDEKLVVSGAAPGEPITVMRLLKFADGIPDDVGRMRHAVGSVPAIQRQFGRGLISLAVNTITEATCLASGTIPYKPVDITEIYKFDLGHFSHSREIVGSFGAPAIAQVEAGLFATDRSFTLVTDEVVFIA